MSKKYSNKLSMKALVEKVINEKTRKRDEEGSTFFYVHLSRELKGIQENSREL